MRLLPLPLIAAALVAPAAAQQRKDSVGHEVTAPLRDTGIRKDKIPPVLLLAASAPYSSVGTRTCATLAAEVGKLDRALGPDVDAPGKKKGEGAAVAALAARTAVNSLIPGLGIVRVLSGADKRQREAEAAVYAGSVRRAYLKGIGRSKRCGPPAAPRAAAVADTPSL